MYQFVISCLAIARDNLLRKEKRFFLPIRCFQKGQLEHRISVLNIWHKMFDFP